MPYTVTPTSLPEVLILEPKVFGDDRGFFFESFNQRDFATVTGLDVQFVQDNHSRSVKGVLRGLHYQIQHPQGKLVRVTQGEVFDVAVDMRRSSPNFGKWDGVVLSASNPTASCGYPQVLPMALWSPATAQSFCTKPQTTGTPSLNAVFFGATPPWVCSGPLMACLNWQPKMLRAKHLMRLRFLWMI